MAFLTTLALGMALFVVVPYLAHRLRRQRAAEQPFPPARLVAPAPPKVRRRSRLEDRVLFGTRATAVVALALLGATPMVRCSRLSLQRASGASVALAIVVDDSMSMRAPLSGARTSDPSSSRFERARRGARELLASAREGDAVAVVLAGAPARVALAPTTDLAAARRTLDGLSPSDRATDIDGAIALARSLVSRLPQVDRRVVLLSDLADGNPDAPALAAVADDVPLWAAMPELRSGGADCAVLRADRAGARVRVTVACGPGASALGRSVEVQDAGGHVIAHATTPDGPRVEVDAMLPNAGADAVRARLSGTDAVAEDDAAPVVTDSGSGSIAVVADASDEAVATGGAPVAEQALAALDLGVDVHPMPTMPDRLQDFAGALGVLLDDPPGLTPEQRRALQGYLDGGGVLLLALGPHAAAAPLGASLEPVLSRAVTWTETRSPGVDAASALGPLADSAASLADLGAPRRAAVSAEDAAVLEPLARWTDGALFAGRRSLGRGEAWVITLPLSVDHSDLALRPAFLALLRAWAADAREHVTEKRSDVGASWAFPGARDVVVTGPSGPVAVERDERGLRAAPPLVGAYRVVVDGRAEQRVAAPAARELDMRPRRVAAGADGGGVGRRGAPIDVSGHLAMVLLALMAVEMSLRVRSARKAV